MNILKNDNGFPASKTERELRRMLCSAHEIMPYMDDGEASGQEIDYMRMPVEMIQKLLQKRIFENLGEKKLNTINN